MRSITRLIALISLLILSPGVNAASKVSAYDLDIEFSPAQSSMQGQAIVTFEKPLEQGKHTFYLHGELDVDTITLNAQELEFETESVYYSSNYALVADKVSFDLDSNVENATLTVTYRGHFHPSKARSPSDYMRIDEDGVLLRAYGYSLWFPVFLADNADVYKVDFANVRFKLPRQYQLVFVGEKVSEQVTDEYAITTWRAEDIDLWGPQVTAREYELLSSDNIHIYHDPGEESREAAQAVNQFTGALLDFFQEHYRQDAGVDNLYLLEMPRYGDISSHNMVGVSSETFRSFESAAYAKRTIAHELVHPFVSLQVSRSDALWSLAIEGLPSYFHLPALRHVYGQGFYDEFMLMVENYYLQNKGVEKDRRGDTRPPEVPLMAISADRMSDYKDDYILWGRTKLFFNYLLAQMGEDAFAAFSKDLFGRRALTERAFVGLCEQYLPGKEVQIQTWLYSNDFPDEFRIQAIE